MPSLILKEDGIASPSKRILGVEGKEATNLNQYREYAHRRLSSIHGPGFDAMFPKVAHDVTDPREATAVRMTSRPHFIHSHQVNKVVHDFPKGGKHTFDLRRPNPIADPLITRNITGRPKRLEPLVFTEERARAIWSEGRNTQIERDAGKIAGSRSVIPYFSPSTERNAAKYWVGGVRKADRGPPVKSQNEVLGFRGMGNQRDIMKKEQMATKARETHAVVGLPFEGQRRKLGSEFE